MYLDEATLIYSPQLCPRSPDIQASEEILNTCRFHLRKIQIFSLRFSVDFLSRMRINNWKLCKIIQFICFW